MDMPRKGYKVITVKEELFKKVDSQASKEKTSIPKIVEKALRDYMETH